MNEEAYATPDPATFEDREGRLWTLDITFGIARQLKASDAAVDLIDAQGVAKVFARLSSDPLVLVDIVWQLVEGQAEKRHKVTRDDFESSLTGGTIEAMANALVAAITNFTRAAKRPAVQAAWDQVVLQEQLAAKKQVDVINSEEFSQAMASRLDASATQAVKNVKKQAADPFPEPPASTSGGSATS